MVNGALQYRYRTIVLVGPWRGSAREAMEDALRAGQARVGAEEGVLSWRVDGTIEERSHLVRGGQSAK